MTNKKKPFVLRLSPSMMNALEKWAADEFRSVNGQIEWIINRALRDSGRLRKDGEGHGPVQGAQEKLKGSAGQQQAGTGHQHGKHRQQQSGSVQEREEGTDSPKKNNN